MGKALRIVMSFLYQIPLNHHFMRPTLVFIFYGYVTTACVFQPMQSL